MTDGAPPREAVPPGFVDSVAWDLADRATRTLALETLEVLHTRRTVEALADRYRASSEPHRAGHLFEVMHALSFNRDAITQRAGVRATVTEWAHGGSQQSASDIDLLVEGSVVAQIQAKLYYGVAAGAHAGSRERYSGMQRLMAGDRAKAVADLLDKRLSMADGLFSPRYREARQHVTDVLHHENVTSRPIRYGEAQAAAVDPVAWINREAQKAAATQLVAGVATAAGASAALDTLINATGSVAAIRAGEMSPMEAAITTCAAAGRAAARSAAATTAGEGIRLAAQLQWMPSGLGVGSLPLAMGRAVCGVAEAGFAYARGDISRNDLAARSAQATAATSLVWAFTAAGQTLIPVPVIGSLAGGLVGQLVAAQCAKGLQMAIVAARQDRVDESRLVGLESELLTAAALAEEFSLLSRSAGAVDHAYIAEVLMPELDTARHALLLSDDDEAMARFADVVARFGHEPLFTTIKRVRRLDGRRSDGADPRRQLVMRGPRAIHSSTTAVGVRCSRR